MRSGTVCCILVMAFVFFFDGLLQYAAAVPQERAGETTKEGIWFDLSAGLSYGTVTGFLQTPAGGNPGTTTRKRPTLEELGISDILSFDGSLDVHWKMSTITMGAQFNRFSDSSTLRSPLVSQNVTFPEDTHVSSDIRMDWYTIGYLYAFDLSPHGREKALTISPGLDAVLLDFHNELKGREDERVDRAYRKGALRLLCNIDWEIAEGLDLLAKASGSLPISNTPSITRLSLMLEKRFLSAPGATASVYLGGAYEKVEYEDNQRVPNHIRAEMWPMASTGVKVRF